MGQREAVLAIAQAQVGINPGGDKFWQYMGYDHHVEWCASFLSWVMNEAGLTAAQWTQSGGVLQIYNGAVGRGDILPSGSIINPGDIVFFEWRNPGDGPDHIGIIEEVDSASFTTIEGNILVNGIDNVGRQTWSKSSHYIWDFARPAYTTVLDPWHKKAAAGMILGLKRRRIK